MADHRQKKPLSMVGLGAITVSLALFTGVFLATSPDDIPDSTSSILSQDQGVPDNVAPVAPPKYKGRYSAGQALPDLSTGTAEPMPGGKDSGETVIRIDVPKAVAAVAPNPFDTCKEALAAGRTNILRNDPKYQKKLDTDNDGVACETVTAVAPKPTTVTPTTVAPAPKTTTAAPAPKTTTVAPAPKTTTAAPAPTFAKCTSIGVQPQTVAACNKVLAAISGIPAVGGVGQRPGNSTSCHPGGLALDFMVYSDKALGDRIFDYVTKNREELGATSVILWQVPDHYDHVHVSLTPCKG